MMVPEAILVAKDFERFVASQQTDQNASAERAQIIEEWLHNLRSLYQSVAAFLDEFVSAGSIGFGYTNVEINEPELGAYLADRMDITIGKQQVSLIPVGTLLVGGKGRVDIHGSSGQAQLLLLRESATSAADLAPVKIEVGLRAPMPPSKQEDDPWIWKIVANTIPKTFVELDKESFFELVMQIANA